VIEETIFEMRVSENEYEGFCDEDIIE